jgi:hypothetical protein
MWFSWGVFSEVIVSYNHAALLMFQEYCNCFTFILLAAVAAILYG